MDLIARPETIAEALQASGREFDASVRRLEFAYPCFETRWPHLREETLAHTRRVKIMQSLQGIKVLA